MKSDVLKRWSVRIDGLPLRTLMLIASLSVLTCAGCFWRWQGVAYSMGTADVSFGNALYFSIITFTSLGYGDIVPRGYGKVLASGEVLWGLAFLGIAIAKLSSTRQSYQLAQLYARDAQERLEDYVITIRESLKGYRLVASSKNGQALTTGIGTMHTNLAILLSRVRTYLSFEIGNGDLLNKMPIGAAAKLLKSCAQLLPYVVEVANTRKSLHSQRQRKHARRVVKEMHQIADLVSETCKDAALCSEAARLQELCTASLNALNQASAAVTASAVNKRELWGKSRIE